MWVVKLNGGNFLKFNNGLFEGVAIGSGDVTATHTPTNYTANNTDTLTTHLSAVDSAIGTLDARGLNSLSDVSFTAGNGIDGYVLKYSNANSRWEAQADVGGNSFTSVLTVDNSETDTTIAQVGTEKRQTVIVKNDTTDVTITLPDSTDVGDGYEIVVKRTGSGTVSVARAGNTDTLDGQDSISIPAQYSSATFVAEDGVGYHII
jgi:hypothetical protein